LECMLFRRRLEMDIAEVRPDIDVLRLAANEARTSQRFKLVLQAVLAVGNALNGPTFRGGARGFQLDALLKLKETKTALSDPACPTLLHYLARTLSRTQPSLLVFIEDLPHVESAARVSVQSVSVAANTIVVGFNQVKEEIEIFKRSKIPGDLFVQVMEPFIRDVDQAVCALKEATAAMDSELKSLLAYFGEASDSANGTKPEDFFALIMSFSSALQKATLEVQAAEPQKPKVPPTVDAFVQESTPSEDSAKNVTLKGIPSPQTLLTPPSIPANTSGRLTIGRGDLDEAIRSIRVGQRPRARQQARPLSKMFLDGSSPGRPTSTLHDN